MKRFLLGLGAFLGLTAGVLTFIPQASPFSAPVRFAAEQVTQHAQQMPDPCDDRLCARDPKTGEAGMRGLVTAYSDGGGWRCVCE